MSYQPLRRLVAHQHGGGVYSATLTGNLSVTEELAQVLVLDGGASNRNVTWFAPTDDYKGVAYDVNNVGATNNLVLKDAAGNTIATLLPAQQARIVFSGVSAGWKVASKSGAGAGGADFGAPGIQADVVAESTSAAGVTVDGLLIKDGDVYLVDNDQVVFGTGNDIAVAWNATNLAITQAAPNSSIDMGVDGAGIDVIFRGDTASAAMTWDQSADKLVFSGVAKIQLQTIAAATGTAIPVTHSGSFPVTTAAAETNTLADPSFLGQTLSIFVDTYAVGDRVITAASRINQAGNTIITLGAVGDYIRLEAITIGGALKWQVVSNDGAALS